MYWRITPSPFILAVDHWHSHSTERKLRTSSRVRSGKYMSEQRLEFIPSGSPFVTESCFCGRYLGECHPLSTPCLSFSVPHESSHPLQPAKITLRVSEPFLIHRWVSSILILCSLLITMRLLLMATIRGYLGLSQLVVNHLACPQYLHMLISIWICSLSLFNAVPQFGFISFALPQPTWHSTPQATANLSNNNNNNKSLHWIAPSRAACHMTPINFCQGNQPSQLFASCWWQI